VKWGFVSVSLIGALSLASPLAFGQTAPSPWAEVSPVPAAAAREPTAPPVTAQWTVPAPTPTMPRPPMIPRGRQDRTERVLIEVGGGALAGLLLGAGGLYIGFIGAVASDPLGGTDMLVNGLYGGIIGAGIGIPIGVYLIGNNFRGNGGLGWTVLGSFGGVAAAVGLALAASNDSIPVGIPVLAGLLLPLAGAALGYELSSHEVAPPARSHLRILPYGTATADGGRFGLVGTF